MPSHARNQAALTHTLLQLTPLEDRITPAVTLRFDYSYDTSGFFNDSTHRAALEKAGSDLVAPITTSLSAITPSGSTNTWQAIFNNPSTGNQVSVNNPTIPADTIIVYVGGLTIGGGEAGFGGPGGYSVSGTRSFQTTVQTRGVTGFSTWGGSVSFDTTANWYFGADASGLGNNKLDFTSVATHELGHVLGFGTSTEFTNLVHNGTLSGTNITSVAGGGVAVSSDQQHLAQGTTSNGNPVSLQPTLAANRRVTFSALDYAVLKDIGWQVSTTPLTPPVVPVTPPVVPVTPPVNTETVPTNSSPIVSATPTTVDPNADVTTAFLVPKTIHCNCSACNRLLAVSGGNDGTVQLYTENANNNLTPVGGPLTPFANFQGAVRTVTADVNGDGTLDVILGTGPGGGSQIRILNGKTLTDLVPQFMAFESSFNGGVYLAAADFDGDGRAEIIVSPDQGGGPRVKTVGLQGSVIQTRADFFGINDSNFRGGARVAAGDVNKDGRPDLIVAAGIGGGPRVSIIDGNSVLNNTPRNLTADFFAFDPTLRNGVYVTIGDMNNDGFGDLIFGAGPGGGPRVRALSSQSLITSGVQTPLADVFVGDVNQRGGVRVSAKDLNGDGQIEIVTGSGTGNQVQVLNANGLTPAGSLIPFSTNEIDGIYVG